MRINYKILLLLLALFFCSNLQQCFLLSQPTFEWIRQYPDTNIFTSVPFSLAVDDYGNVYTTGHSEIGTWYFYTTIKYNPGGVLQWAVNFFGDTAGGRYPYNIAVDKQSNVYVTGYSYMKNTTFFDFCTVKYDSNGIQQWVSYYDNPTHFDDIARKIAIDNAGNIYVSGTSELCLFSCRIYTTIKYSNSGDQIWSRTYGSGIQGHACDLGDMIIDDDCNVYITGVNNYDAVTIKYDSSGNPIWVNSYSINSNSAIAKSILLDKDNNAIISGQGVNGDRYSSFTIKYSSSGKQRWANIIRPTSLDTDSYASNSVVADKNGNIYISGLYQHNDMTPRRLFVVKYSYNGDSLWTVKSIDSAVPPISYMDIDNDDNIYALITKRIYSNPFYLEQIDLFKFDTTGTLIWEEATDIPPSISARGLKVDNNFNIYLSGYSNHKITTIKYSQPLYGIKKINNVVPEKYNLYQNYPNPFNPATKIKISLPYPSHEGGMDVNLIIYDIIGKEITVLINECLKPGTYEVEWDASKYSSGIYFYKLIVRQGGSSTGDFIETKKMVLIK